MGRSNRKAVIKNVDMSETMQQDIVNLANYALNLHTVEQDIAKVIKQECDKKYQPTWHCIVGRNFGSYVTYESSSHIYFHMDNVAILVFKSV